MNKRDLIDLMERFEASGIARMRYQAGDASIELEKAAPASASARPFPVQAVPAAGSPSATPDSQQELPCIAAPFVGTFYAKPAPDSEPFVSVGDRVEAGQTVCLLEAMKMMSEVQAPCDCVIEQIVAVDGELVSYDAPIMRYREV